MEKEYVRYKVDTAEYKSYINHCDSYILREVFRKCVKWFLDKKSVHIDPICFLSDFMQSNVRLYMERGQHSFVHETTNFILNKYISVDLQDDFSKYVIDEPTKYDKYIFEWIGASYVAIKMRTDYTSKYINSRLDIKTMMLHFVSWHEVAVKSYCEQVIPLYLDCDNPPDKHKDYNKL